MTCICFISSSAQAHLSFPIFSLLYSLSGTVFLQCFQLPTAAQKYPSVPGTSPAQAQGNWSPPRPNPIQPLAVSRRLLSFASSPGPSTRSSPRPPPTFVRVRASARPSFLLDLSGCLLVHLVPLRPLARVALCQKITRWSFEHASPFGPLFLFIPYCSFLFTSFAPSFLSLLFLLLLLLFLFFFFYPPVPELSFPPTRQLRQALDCFANSTRVVFPRWIDWSVFEASSLNRMLGSQLGPDLFAKARRQAPRLTVRLSSTSNRKPRPFGHVHSAHISY